MPVSKTLHGSFCKLDLLALTPNNEKRREHEVLPATLLLYLAAIQTTLVISFN